jgi:hypothetical protein
VRVDASVKNISDDVCSEWVTLALVGRGKRPDTFAKRELENRESRCRAASSAGESDESEICPSVEEATIARRGPSPITVAPDCSELFNPRHWDTREQCANREAVVTSVASVLTF